MQVDFKVSDNIKLQVSKGLELETFWRHFKCTKIVSYFTLEMASSSEVNNRTQSVEHIGIIYPYLSYDSKTGHLHQLEWHYRSNKQRKIGTCGWNFIYRAFRIIYQCKETLKERRMTKFYNYDGMNPITVMDLNAKTGVTKGVFYTLIMNHHR